MRTQRRAVRKLLPGQPAGGTAPDETRPSRSRKPSLKLLETVEPKKVCALDCCTPPPLRLKVSLTLCLWVKGAKALSSKRAGNLTQPFSVSATVCAVNSWCV
jgi:hypothetical protein